MPRKKKERGYVGRLTGREYPSARGLGEYQWEPNPGSWQDTTLTEIKKILTTNAAYLPLRPRAILYRLMGQRLATKADDSRLTDLITSARRSGYIDWDDIDDGRSVVIDIGGYDDPADYWRSTVSDIEHAYRRALRQNQDWFIELWVESAGYLPVLERVAGEFGAVLITGSGFNPVKRIRQSAIDARERFVTTHQRTILIFLGDCDPSGMTRIDRSDSDIRQFFIDAMGGNEATRDLDGEDYPVSAIVDYVLQSEWLGLTADQAVDLGLLDENGNPAVAGKAGKFELEAVPPATVVGWVRDAFERYTDMAVLETTKETAEVERTRMSAAVKRMIKRWK
jgi:hypothetical protein